MPCRSLTGWLLASPVRLAVLPAAVVVAVAAATTATAGAAAGVVGTGGCASRLAPAATASVPEFESAARLAAMRACSAANSCSFMANSSRSASASSLGVFASSLCGERERGHKQGQFSAADKRRRSRLHATRRVPLSSSCQRFFFASTERTNDAAAAPVASRAVRRAKQRAPHRKKNG